MEHNLQTLYVTSFPREGVYFKKHLLGGVAKGAFGEAEADTKFEAWEKQQSKQVWLH
jgi:hypothetical protein